MSLQERVMGIHGVIPCPSSYVARDSRFLDALEKKYKEDHRIMAGALSFADYGKAGE